MARSVLKTKFISHGTLGSKDLEATRRFYEEFLGLEVVRTSPVSLMIRLGGNHVRMQRLAAAVVEHDRARPHIGGEIVRQPAEMDVAVVRIDVDRMRRVVEVDPVPHC